MYIYCNSQFIKDTEATISPFDHGFLYGIGAFETFRIYKGFPFLLHDHMRRLQEALRELGIYYQIDFDEIKSIIKQLVKLNGFEEEDVTARLNISAGVGEVGKLVQDYRQPTILLFIRKAPSLEVEEKNAAFLKLRRNTPEGDFRLKSHHYLNNILGKRELINHPDVEGIFLTREGYIAEGIVSNIFWIKGNKVYTPSLDTGILNGITRLFVIKCLAILNIPCEEGFYPKEEIKGASEVLITNSSQEILAVKKVDSYELAGKDGEVYRKLNELYARFRSKLLSIDEM
ncbi:aminodeoxychorismate lyase [Metabacillus niabensis]|uniref:4-amino-4-deoxychorismate lyase n=1 Tax=Metabacillus niabensis TaxID=324854 RepID=A0ABT9Z8D6_9BACI|nr:aminodeoxychorismate lyase [Metabacillus niabensis]MDQ0228497.1 4-amino-4-deoxychorismate lyase [Metabacillus niabensis]